MQPQFTIQRLRGGFAVVWHDAAGKRHRRQLAARDRLGAEAEARRRIAAGRTSRWTVGGLVGTYIADRESRGTASVGRMRDAWKALKPAWEQVDPATIDEAMCRGWAARRARSAATVRYELAMIGTACKWAERNRMLERAPALWLPQPPPRRERHISREQFEAFHAAIRAPHARLYATLGIGTAARPGAILQLTWAQISFDRRLVYLNPESRRQTSKGRATVPMTARVEAALREAWAARTCDHVIEHGGGPVASVKKAFAAASQRVGFQVTPYTLRHSAAVWMAESGVPMEEIAAYLGHSDARTTFQHYARFGPDYLRKAAGALDW
jgi:integrase